MALLVLVTVQSFVFSARLAVLPDGPPDAELAELLDRYLRPDAAR
jgi:hypothetical protein